MSDISTPGWTADNDAGSTRSHSDPITTTEHLRRLWSAGAREITVTYDEKAVRHRGYLLRPRSDVQ